MFSAMALTDFPVIKATVIVARQRHHNARRVPECTFPAMSIAVNKTTKSTGIEHLSPIIIIIFTYIIVYITDNLFHPPFSISCHCLLQSVGAHLKTPTALTD